MTALRNINALIISLILISAANDGLAASTDSVHADPSLIYQDRYGPIRPNDTLWSIAKLFVKKGESVSAVIAELEQANPKTIRHANTLFVGEYIFRHPQVKTDVEFSTQPKLAAELHNIEPVEITLIPETTAQPAIHNIPETTPTTPDQSSVSEEPSSSIFVFLLMLISILGAGLFLGLIRLKRQRLQQQIQQEELDKINALKRESIKNRLKPTSD